MADEPFTADDYARWMHPKAALSLLGNDYGEWGVAAAAIIARLRVGLVRSAAATWRQGTRAGSEPATIPAVNWSKSVDLYSRHGFWSSSDHEINLGDQYRPLIVTYYGIRFEPKGINSLLTTPIPEPEAPLVGAPSLPIPPAPVSNRGRPRADFWDDLLVAMFRRIHFGDLKPKRQADIEKAMLDWASENSVSVNESSVRPRAAKIWKALKEEG